MQSCSIGTLTAFLLDTGYELRDRSIHRCVEAAMSSVAALRAEVKANPDDTDLELDLLREQDKLSNIKCTHLCTLFVQLHGSCHSRVCSCLRLRAAISVTGVFVVRGA